MIFIYMHARIEGRANPSHTESGLKELTVIDNLLMQFDTETSSPIFLEGVGFIGVGVGTRSEEVFRNGCSAFAHIPVEYFDLLGIGVSRRGDKIITPMGTELSAKKHNGLSKSLPPRVVWDYFLNETINKKAKGDKLLCTVREFLVALGAPKEGDYSNSIFKADVKKRSLEWIVKHGQVLDEPEPLPLKIFWHFKRS